MQSESASTSRVLLPAKKLKKKSIKKTNIGEDTPSLRRVDTKKAKELSIGKDSIGSKRSSIDSVVNPNKKQKQSKASEVLPTITQKFKKSKLSKLSKQINSSPSLSPIPIERKNPSTPSKKIVYEQQQLSQTASFIPQPI